ncbi:hypothetical protein BsWGS_17117 [Bradybaena similaris]
MPKCEAGVCSSLVNSFLVSSVYRLYSVLFCDVGCRPAWFGARCQYKCHCVNDKCDDKGMCTGGFTCRAGWFGPACQYADLAYLQKGPQVLTDADDTTCIFDPDLNNITISLNETNFFTWMRILINIQAVAPAAMDDLKVAFSVKTVRVICDELKIYVVDKSTRDIHCSLTKAIDGLTLTGRAVSSRNVALKQYAYQNASYSNVVYGKLINYTADLAVDGDTRQHFQHLSCSAGYKVSKWTLILSMPRGVHRYVIYNRLDSNTQRSIGFKLNSFDSRNNIRFAYKDPSRTSCTKYYIKHSSLPVQAVTITFDNIENVVQLCEVEVYGDSICDTEHYGRDCENTCNCLNDETCLVSTGGCSSGCPTGFFGPDCQDTCHFGIVNDYCNMPCSQNCAPFMDPTIQSCNETSGACLWGCKSGFDGEFCKTVCDFGTFGAGCESSCSENCSPSGDDKISPCNASTGTCLQGCKNGFLGDLCQDSLPCPPGTFGEDCNSLCSENCAESDNETTCDSTTGECLEGCISGFSGALCLDECDAGKFGPNCNISCSQNCVSVKDRELPCDSVTGKCYRGCRSGFHGDLCLRATSLACEGSSVGHILAGYACFSSVFSSSASASGNDQDYDNVQKLFAKDGVNNSTFKSSLRSSQPV